jgi:WD40 repeat protein
MLNPHSHIQSVQFRRGSNAHAVLTRGSDGLLSQLHAHSKLPKSQRDGWLALLIEGLPLTGVTTSPGSWVPVVPPLQQGVVLPAPWPEGLVHGAVSALAYGPCGQLAIGDGFDVHVAGRRLWGDGVVTALAWSPDGTTVASCWHMHDREGALELWDVATGSRTIGAEGPVVGLDWHQAGLLWSGAGHVEHRVGDEVMAFKADQAVRPPRWNPAGTRFAAMTRGGRIRVFQPP